MLATGAMIRVMEGNMTTGTTVRELRPHEIRMALARVAEEGDRQ